MFFVWVLTTEFFAQGDSLMALTEVITGMFRNTQVQAQRLHLTLERVQQFVKEVR